MIPVNSETTPETDIAETLSQNTGGQIMRETVAEIISEYVGQGSMHSKTSCGRTAELKAADAIIAALPDMVVPLQWEDHPLNGEPVLSRAKVAGGAYFICDDTDDFTGYYLVYVSCDDVRWWQSVRSTSVELQSHFHDDDIAPLKAAAQSHHVAQVLSAFGITPPDAGKET